MSALALFSIAALAAAPARPGPSPRSVEATRRTETLVSEYVGELARKTDLAVVMPSVPIPSFSRQTGLACNACHTSFPQLNAFGRLFKLNGYTMTTLQTVKAQDTDSKTSLSLDLIPPISTMVISSLTSVRRDVPGEQNTSMAFPQELGLFMGGAITPKIGTFLQLTYDPAEGSIGVDNADIRFADHATVGGKDVAYGITLNNSPTVQDLWNSTPVWGYPFVGSEVAPTPMAATLIEDGLGQTVMGVGSYALWNNLLYTELTLYRSAFQGGPVPVDESAENAVYGVAPYWRVALQRNITGGQMMVGGYGMVSLLTPAGFEGARDRYADVALDAQLDKTLGSGGSFVAHGTWIHENRQLDATAAAGDADHANTTLRTLRLDAAYYSASRLGFAGGYFATTGDADAALYPSEAVSGSATGRPDSRGYLLQVSYMPWMNTRLGLQYVGYTSFNGASRNYDGAGRDASDNNALYLMTWLVF